VGDVDAVVVVQGLKEFLQLGGMLEDRAPAEFGRGKKVAVRDVLIETLLKIRDKEGRLRGITLNRAQREYAQRATRRNVVLKARQLGISTYVAARFFVDTITRPGTLTVQVAHDQESAEQIFRIVHRFLETMPELFKSGVLRTSRANTRQLVFPELDSEYRVGTAADPNAGRGLTIHNLHCSEVARWPRDGAATLASLRAAVPPGGCVTLESTPNGAGGVFYDEWQRAEITGYTRHFFPWWWDKTYRREGMNVGETTDEERELMRVYDLQPEQIAFRREMKANFGRRCAEEFAEDATTCFLSSGECVFDVDLIAERLAKKMKPIEERDGGRIHIYWPVTMGDDGAPRRYIIGVDPAGGGADGDYACAQLIERDSGIQVAELRGHYNPEQLALRVADLAREYNNALVAVERNNHGHAVLAHLNLSQGFVNVYSMGGQPGWITSAATRPMMLENFASILRRRPDLFSSQTLFQECRTFVRHGDGSSSAAGGTHDDTVMAMAIALAVRRERAGQLQ